MLTDDDLLRPRSPVLIEMELSDTARRAMAEIVRSEIRAALDGPAFTAAELSRIARLVAAAKPFFASRDPLDRPRLGPGETALAGSPLTETFGASALREITEVARAAFLDKGKPRVEELTRAIAEADGAGLEHVKVLLEAQLRELLGVPVVPGTLIGTIDVPGQEQRADAD